MRVWELVALIVVVETTSVRSGGRGWILLGTLREILLAGTCGQSKREAPGWRREWYILPEERWCQTEAAGWRKTSSSWPEERDLCLEPRELTSSSPPSPPLAWGGALQHSHYYFS